MTNAHLGLVMFASEDMREAVAPSGRNGKRN
jgi:hypothetical protein